MSVKDILEDKESQKWNIKWDFLKTLKCDSPSKLSAIIKEEALKNPCLIIEEATDEQETDSDLKDEAAVPIDGEIETDQEFYHDEEIEEDQTENINYREVLDDISAIDLVEDMIVSDELMRQIAEQLSNDKTFNEILEEICGQDLNKNREIEASISIRYYNEDEREITVYGLPGIGGLSLNQELRKHTKEDYNKALNLINTVKSYRYYLDKIANIIANRQKDFFVSSDFADAVKSLKLFTQEEMARILKVHKSTITRIVKGKFVDTKFGYIPLQYFFTRKGYRGKSLDSTPSKVKIEILKEIVASKEYVPGDKEIQGIFKTQGIDISIEMVRHYREKIGITKRRGRK